MNTKKLFLSVILIALLLPITSLAKRPEFARTAEEWAHLRDNTLAYEEIPDLVEEYNATVLQNEAKRASDEGRNYTAQETSDHLYQMADDYDQMAIEAENTTGGAITAASYRMMADQVRSQAEENTGDAVTVQYEYDRAQAEIVKTVRELFLSYYRQQAQNTLSDKNIAYLEKAHASAENLKKYGMGTELDVLTALESLQNAKAEAVTGESLLTADYRKLITLCGWQYDSQAEIGPVPEADLLTIASVNASLDQAAALAASYTVKTDERRLQNARDIYGNGTVVTKMEAQLASDKNTVIQNLQSAEASLLLAKATYDASAMEVTLTADSLAKAARQYNLGTISRREYETAEYTFDKAELSKEIALYDLLLARLSYDAIVEGL